MGALTVEKRIEIACALRDLDKSHYTLFSHLIAVFGNQLNNLDNDVFLNAISKNTFDIFLDILGLADFKSSSDEVEHDIYIKVMDGFFNFNISNEELIDSISDFIE